jgi:hypothetical protein
MAFLVLLVLAFRAARDTGLQLGLPPLVRFDLWLSQATAVLALGLPIAAVSAWRMGYWSRAGRLHYALCTAGALGFAVVLDYWHLLGR